MLSADTALAALHGIGPARAQGLSALGLETAWDLLHAPPRCLGPPPPLCEAGAPVAGAPVAGEVVRVRARLLSVVARFNRGREPGLEAVLERADGQRLRARFFRAGWLARLLVPGGWFLFEGALDRR